MSNPHGTPIWYELLTSDVEGAKKFYGDIVGWNTVAFPGDAGMDYHIWQVGGAGDANVGGLANPPENAPMGPIWLAYFFVEDVDAKVAEVEAAGGKTMMPASDIPNVGRIALVADPQGPLFYLMKPTPPPGMEGGTSTAFSPTLPGRCAWNELITSDQKAALPFYSKLLGWTSTEVMNMGAMGDYTFIDCGGERLGAMMDRASPDQPLKWTYYFAIPDVDAAAPRIAALGGQVIMGPMDVPGGQRVVLALDPQGASVGFVSGERQ